MNSLFYETLRKGCPWQRVQKTVETLGISPIAPNLLIEWEHRMIYEAVLRGDPAEVRAAVEYHILRTKNNLITYMELLNSENLK